LDFDVRETTGVPDLDTGWDGEFQASEKRWDEIWRQREEEARKERQLEQWIEEVQAETARDEKRDRPIKVKTFSIE